MTGDVSRYLLAPARPEGGDRRIHSRGNQGAEHGKRPLGPIYAGYCPFNRRSGIVRWVDGGALKGDPNDMPAKKEWPDESKWNFAKQFGGPPDLIVKSPAYTVAAVAQDAWFKPVVETGLTEERWVRAIEIHPSTVKGRKITHHALARLAQDEPNAPPTAAGLFMEWAVGKQGEIM